MLGLLSMLVCSFQFGALPQIPKNKRNVPNPRFRNLGTPNYRNPRKGITNSTGPGNQHANGILDVQLSTKDKKFAASPNKSTADRLKCWKSCFALNRPVATPMKTALASTTSVKNTSNSGCLHSRTRPRARFGALAFGRARSGPGYPKPKIKSSVRIRTMRLGILRKGCMPLTRTLSVRRR